MIVDGSETVSIKLIDGKSMYKDAQLVSTDVSTAVIIPRDENYQLILPWTSILYMRYAEEN